MPGLKPNEEIQVGALTAALVYGIFQLDAPNLADVRASQAGSKNAVQVHGSVKTAAWTSAVAVSGLALLAKSPTIFVIGGLMIIGESWKFFHANVIDPGTGKVPDGAGQPAQ